MLGSGVVSVNVKWGNRETVTAQTNKGVTGHNWTSAHF